MSRESNLIRQSTVQFKLLNIGHPSRDPCTALSPPLVASGLNPRPYTRNVTRPFGRICFTPSLGAISATTHFLSKTGPFSASELPAMTLRPIWRKAADKNTQEWRAITNPLRERLEILRKASGAPGCRTHFTSPDVATQVRRIQRPCFGEKFAWFCPDRARLTSVVYCARAKLS
jgi:hypothetical protein